MLVDANILLYAVDATSRYHASARGWLEDALNGPRRVGIPWQSVGAFLRIVTHPRAMAAPLQVDEAWSIVDAWLAVDTVWQPGPGPGHRAILRRLMTSLDLRGNLVTDALLAAVAVEHGLTIVSADTDFARFMGDVRWHNPVAG